MNLLVCLRTTARAGSELLDDADIQALAHGAAMRAAGYTVTALYAASTTEAPAVAARVAPYVDRAVRVVSDELVAADFHTIGQVLAMAIRRIGAELVLAPLQGDQEAASGAPAAIARHLGGRYVPFVEEIVGVEPAGGSAPARAEVVVRGGGHKRRLRVALPAVLATTPGTATLPSPDATASEAILETMALGDPDATVVRRRTELLGRAEPSSRGTQTVSSAAALVAALARR